MAISGVGFGVLEQSRYDQEAAQAASEYSRYAAAQASETCRILTGSQQSQCLANAKSEYELQRRDNRREYDDLVAQQRSALWTSIMGVAAVTGMVLSVFGVWLVYATFHETRRSANEARRSADAFIAAERGWLTMTLVGKNRQIPGEDINQRVFLTLDGRSGVEVTGFSYIGLPNPRFPGENAGYVTKELARRIELADAGKPVNVHNINFPQGPKFIGGWVSYRTKFPGERRTYFVGKVKTTEFPEHNQVIHVIALRRDDSWPENT